MATYVYGGSADYEKDLNDPGNWAPLAADPQPDAVLARRLLAILRGEAECPRCGARPGEPCLTWRGQTFLDGYTHKERSSGDLSNQEGNAKFLAERQ